MAKAVADDAQACTEGRGRAGQVRAGRAGQSRAGQGRAALGAGTLVLTLSGAVEAEVS